MEEVDSGVSWAFSSSTTAAWDGGAGVAAPGAGGGGLGVEAEAGAAGDAVGAAGVDGVVGVGADGVGVGVDGVGVGAEAAVEGGAAVVDVVRGVEGPGADAAEAPVGDAPAAVDEAGAVDEAPAVDAAPVADAPEAPAVDAEEAPAEAPAAPDAFFAPALADPGVALPSSSSTAFRTLALAALLGVGVLGLLTDFRLDFPINNPKPLLSPKPLSSPRMMRAYSAAGRRRERGVGAGRKRGGR